MERINNLGLLVLVFRVVNCFWGCIIVWDRNIWELKVDLKVLRGF